jgi:hypothetical protein
MKIELTIPQNWNEISLKQFRQLIMGIQGFGKLDEINILKWRIRQLHILNPHISEETLLKLKLSQLSEYFTQIEWLDNEPIKEIIKEWIINDKKYYLNEFKNLSVDQWISAEKWSNIEDGHRLISIFYIDPREFSEIEVDRICDKIDNEPVTKSFYLMSQFFFIQKSLEISGQMYIQKMQEMKRLLEKTVKIDKWIRQRLYKLGFKSSKKSQVTI